MHYAINSELIVRALAFSSLVILSGCGGGGGSSGGSSSVEVTFELSSLGDVFTQSPYQLTTNNIVALSADKGQIVQDADNPNRWYYTFNSEGIFNRTLTFPLMETFTYTDTEGNTKSMDMEIILSDPLIRYQWHIYNNSDNEYEKLGYVAPPLPNLDLRVAEAWNLKDDSGKNISGEGVLVGIVDYPVDFEHEDLSANKQEIDSGNSTYSTFNNSLELDLLKQDVESAHGTLVAGIVAASGNNGKGLRGIAYNSKLLSINGTDHSMAVNSFTEVANLGVQLLSHSMGVPLRYIYSEAEALIMDSLYEEDIPIIESMGNFFTSVKVQALNNCYLEGVNCLFRQNTAMSASAHTIQVGAVDSYGKRASYSTTGSSIWVSGFAGAKESNNFAIVSTISHYPCSDYQKTVKIGGLSIITNVLDDFSSLWYSLIGDDDHKCLYTQSMSGTSASTPTVSSVVSLMKQMEPDLTVDQVKYILAKSSRNDQVLPSMYASDRKVFDGALSLGGAWSEHNDQLRYSTDYGFGLVDAYAAVELARDCNIYENCSRRTELPDSVLVSDQVSCQKKNSSALSDISVYECAFSGLTYESEDAQLDGQPFDGKIQIESTVLNLNDFRFASDNSCEFGSELPFSTTELYYAPLTNFQLELVSPAQRSSVIKPYYALWTYYVQNSNFALNGQLISQEFYLDEISSADTNYWKMKVYSKCEIDPSTLEKFQLKIAGYKL